MVILDTSELVKTWRSRSKNKLTLILRRISPPFVAKEEKMKMNVLKLYDSLFVDVLCSFYVGYGIK